MKRAPKTPALAKLAMLLLFAIATVAILETTSISAQELGRTITSPFGIARQTSTSESGSDGDTFIDPETGEVGHIIRNPFGVANPEGVDTGIDIPDSGEEVGGIITSPFGVPASDDIDTGVDVLDEDEEYLISLPDDEESDAEDAEDVDEVDDKTSDEVKVFEEESAETTTEKYVPVIDNPTRGREYPSFNFTLEASAGSMTVSNETGSNTPIIYVSAGDSIHMQAILTNGSWPSESPIWTLSPNPENQPLTQGVSDISLPTNANGMSDLPLIPVPDRMNFRRYTITAFAGNESRSIQIVVARVDLQIDSNNDGRITVADDPVENNNPGKIIMVNDGDLDQDGIPDYYDGFNIEANEISSQRESCASNRFTSFKIQLKDILPIIPNRDAAHIMFYYDSSNPDNDEIVGTGSYNDPYIFIDDEKPFRIWKRDGKDKRNKMSILEGGDFIPSDVFIALSQIGNANTITLYLESKKEILYSQIRCSLFIDDIDQVFSDTIRVSSFNSFVKAIDISGYKNDGIVDNFEINRIPQGEEIDGIVADGLNGIDDGAALLLCFSVPEEIVNYIYPESITFGYQTSSSPSILFHSGLPLTNGNYIDEIPASSQNLVIPEINIIQNGRKIIKQVVYCPPKEMDLTSDFTTEAIRNIDLVAKFSIAGGSKMYSHKRLILARPPLLMIHGINGNAESVFDSSGFSATMNEKGILTYGVNHNNDKLSPFYPNNNPLENYSNTPSYYGNGDIDKSYQFLRDRICCDNPRGGIEPVLPMFRNGDDKAIKGKRIAIQKVDVVAYSYGGLLARWYVEKANEYDSRRDVRKIITIGTPHRGSPITNLMCESYMNSLFANAVSGWKTPAALVSSVGIRDIWGILNYFGKVKWFKGMGAPLNSLPLWYMLLFYPVALEQSVYDDYINSSIRNIPGDDSLVHYSDLYEALHVIAHRSLKLNELNNSPLRNDVAYASIVGTNPNLVELVNLECWLNINIPSSWAISNPKSDNSSNLCSERSFYPWIELIETYSDGIVPRDSQRLVKKDINLEQATYDNIVFEVDESHLGEVKSPLTKSTVVTWLKSQDLLQGQDLDQRFRTLTTEYNRCRDILYSLQDIDYDGYYRNTGVNNDAIVQTILTIPTSPEHHQTDNNILGPHGGLVTVKCTGMINSASGALSIAAYGDESNGNLDIVLKNSISIPNSGPLGILTPFSHVGRYIGRSLDSIENNYCISIRGVDGSRSKPIELNLTPPVWNIGYMMNICGARLISPPAQLVFSLEDPIDPLDDSSTPEIHDVISYIGDTPKTYIARGGFHVSQDALDSNNHNQNLTIKVYNQNEYPSPGALLVETNQPVELDSDLFAGILVPYETSIVLSKDQYNHVSGIHGSSGAAEAHVYQIIVDNGIPSIPSQTITITTDNTNP